jgi:hypothetical protein
MWVMHVYISRITREGNKMMSMLGDIWIFLIQSQRERLGHKMLVDFEMRGFRYEQVAFILDAMLSETGVLSIANSKM